MNPHGPLPDVVACTLYPYPPPSRSQDARYHRRVLAPPPQRWGGARPRHRSPTPEGAVGGRPSTPPTRPPTPPHVQAQQLRELRARSVAMQQATLAELAREERELREGQERLQAHLQQVRDDREAAYRRQHAETPYPWDFSQDDANDDWSNGFPEDAPGPALRAVPPPTRTVEHPPRARTPPVIPDPVAPRHRRHRAHDSTRSSNPAGGRGRGRSARPAEEFSVGGMPAGESVRFRDH